MLSFFDPAKIARSIDKILPRFDLLKKLAAGAPEARLTQEAKAALERLAKRSPAP